jgi:hypothetical protein
MTVVTDPRVSPRTDIPAIPESAVACSAAAVVEGAGCGVLLCWLPDGHTDEHWDSIDRMWWTE